MISKIADGIDVQRGAIFGFGTHANDDTGSLFKVAEATDEEMKELDHTNVHNLAEERSVGSINNEIKIRGKRNLESASRKLVLNKSFDLIERAEPKKYLDFRKPAQDITLLKKDWLQKIQLLENESYATKDDVNKHLEAVKYKDLEYLKTKGGPFSHSQEVEDFMAGSHTDQEKNERLYVEVRYAKNTSLRLKHSDPVFRLKRDYQNLSNEEYSHNLTSYFGNNRKRTSITSNDLNDAILKITGCNSVTLLPNKESSQSIDTNIPEKESPHSNPTLKPGEHIVIFWIENSNDFIWYLGIVDSLSSNKINVLHLKRTDKIGLKWVLPENPEILSVDHDQILLKSVNVMYYGLSCRIEISKATANEIMKCVESKKR